MTKNQTNPKKMYEATNNNLDANAVIWSAIPVVGRYKSRLVEIMNSIEKSARSIDD